MIEVVHTPLSGPDVWLGPEIQHDPGWIWTLSADELDEIDQALAGVRAADAEIPFAAASFPLPTLGARLAGIVAEVGNGRGVVLLRGLERENYSRRDCELIYWGIASHIGWPVSQNARGHVLGHVTDEGRDLSDPDARGYQTRNRLDFHCDQLPVDIVGLFCLRTAKTGGLSHLVSAAAVHNRVLAERPDLLDVLYRPFHVDWRGDHPDGEQPWYDVPMFSAAGGRISARVTNRSFMESTVRYGLTLSDLQREALDVVQEIANRPALRLSMEFREGDMQFINNHAVMHARDAYEDHEDPELKRHLLRMWIALPDDIRRPLSPLLRDRYRYVEIGGIPRQA